MFLLSNRSAVAKKTLFLSLSLVTGLSMGAREARAYSNAQYESVTTDEERQITQVRDQEINQLQIVMGRRFSESRRPDILLRLAEIYVEKYRFYFLKENEIHNKLIAEGKKPKHVEHTKSQAYLNSATNVCLSILKSKVQFAKLDQVYYFLGYNNIEMGREAEAMKWFQRVVDNYPRSTYAPEAFRNLAETAFSQKKYDLAVKYYESAARFTKVDSYPRTLYKLAWAYFKTRRKTEALETMKRAISLSSGNEKFVGLREEALNDIVLFFSEAGRAKEAHDYFNQISGGAELYVKALTKLSMNYERRGEVKSALGINQTLIAEYGEKRPDLVYETLGRNVELYKKVGDGKGEEAALNRLVQFFAANSERIGKTNDDSLASYLRVKGYVRGRATEFHKEAQKKKTTALYSRAADLYGLYVRAFLSSPESEKEQLELSEIRTYRADALLASNREDEALVELENVLHGKGQEKNRKEAGSTLLNVLLKRIDKAQNEGSKSLGDLEKRFLRNAEYFEDVFPDDKLIAELRYKKARLAAGKSGPEGLSKEARGALTELVEKYPSRPESLEAAQDLVADAVKRKESSDARELARAFLANAALMKGDRKQELSKYLKAVLSRQSFADVQSIEKDQEFAKAAQEYERLAAGNQDSEVAYKALNNAAVNYDKAGKLDEALRIHLRILSQFSRRADAVNASKEQLKRLSSQQIWNSQFATASKFYGKLVGVKAFTNGERLSFARSALVLGWGTGDYVQGFLAGSQGLRELCEPAYHDDRCHELAIDLGRLLIDARKTQEATAHLRHYLGVRSAGARKAEAAFLLSQLNADSRKGGVYLEEASHAVTRGGGKRKAESLRERNFAARAAFQLVEPHFTAFNALTLSLPEEKMKRTTKQKLQMMESLVTRYQAVVSLGDGEWGIAALERLYDAFSRFALELERAPVPPRIAPDKVELYKRSIQQIAQPMQAKALEYLKQGHKLGLRLAVTSPTFVALTQRLAKRQPREFPPAHFAMVRDKQSAMRILGVTREANADDLREAGHSWRREIAERLAKNPKSVDAWVEFGNLESLAGRYKLARLMYEQALSFQSRSAAALSNLAVVQFLEQHSIEATQGFAKAAELADQNREAKFNYARALLAYHHFEPALGILKSLSARFPDDAEVSEAFATAQLGVGQHVQAAGRLNALGAETSKQFNLWYNWSVWAGLWGDANQKERALDLLKGRNVDGALEKSQVELATALLGGSAK